MKPRLNVDWNLALALYLKGIKPHDIPQQLQVNVATLKKHGQRHGWTALKAKVSEHLSLNEPTNPTKKAVSFAERAKAVQEAIAVDLHGTAEMLHKIPRSKNPTHLAKRQGVVDQVATTGVKVFGWKSEPGSMLIDVMNLATARTITDPEELRQLKEQQNKLLPDLPPVQDDQDYAI